MNIIGKKFAERLNDCLDETDAPASIKERANILSKLLDISKQEAWKLLDGQQIPKEEMLRLIAQEFEVEPEWLAGIK